MSFLQSFLESVGMQPNAIAEQQDQNSAFGKIMSALDSVPKDEATYTTALAMMLGHIAYADMEISVEEQEFLFKILKDNMGLDEDTAQLVCEIAVQEPVWTGIEISKVWEALNERCSRDEKKKLLHLAFEIAAFDGINPEEVQSLELLSRALGFQRQEYIDIKLDYTEHMTYKRN